LDIARNGIVVAWRHSLGNYVHCWTRRAYTAKKCLDGDEQHHERWWRLCVHGSHV